MIIYVYIYIHTYFATCHPRCSIVQYILNLLYLGMFILSLIFPCATQMTSVATCREAIWSRPSLTSVAAQRISMSSFWAASRIAPASYSRSRCSTFWQRSVACRDVWPVRNCRCPWRGSVRLSWNCVCVFVYIVHACSVHILFVDFRYDIRYVYEIK